MSVVLSARTSAQIASEINLIKSRTDKIILQNCVQIGHCLTEAKAVLPYGEWGKWLKEEVSYSQRTAEHLMRIYREFGSKLASPGEDLPDSNLDSNLSFSQAVVLLGIPAEEREEFMACHDVENMSKRELQAAVQEKKQREELVPIVRVTQKLRKIQPKTVLPTAENRKYDEQFALHRDNMLSAYNELLKTLVAQSRIDTARKEINRKKALEIATNMVKTLQEYPPAIRTNMDIETDNPG
ncbi:DUF3102 domain-containing protein [Desulfosporosinus lacus]|uniref:Protein export cytoplasm protein SecA ATPase RNA helicase n=1 Tax=Desulfosporosinus lacus DSM 15449 TaxID=1121420 RepID=A0A1M6FLV6_9FIRM|nr:DUF3102 domain-containing protein [Desulfosporosinus lacus]SHI98646.1 Protein of unknown function [Desulfosporosinus lacus DSM 15449]